MTFTLRGAHRGGLAIRNHRTKQEAMEAILAVLDFFRVHGKPRERFGDTLQRTGFPALETFVEGTVVPGNIVRGSP